MIRAAVVGLMLIGATARADESFFSEGGPHLIGIEATVGLLAGIQFGTSLSLSPVETIGTGVVGAAMFGGFGLALQRLLPFNIPTAYFGLVCGVATSITLLNLVARAPLAPGDGWALFGAFFQLGVLAGVLPPGRMELHVVDPLISAAIVFGIELVIFMADSAVTDFAHPYALPLAVWPLPAAVLCRVLFGEIRRNEPVAIAPMRIRDGYGAALTVAF